MFRPMWVRGTPQIEVPIHFKFNGNEMKSILSRKCDVLSILQNLYAENKKK